MNRTCALAVLLAFVAVATAVSPAAAGDVNINIGTPAPPVAAVVIAPPPVIVEKPRVLRVPETKVYTAPSLSFDVFLFGGKYWSHHHDQWFVTATIGAPWTHVVYETVPVEIRRLPAKYYKVPPGHAKKMKHDDDDDDHPGRGKGAKGCPPGLAKQGRC